jgi:hypothetical protein
MIRKLIVIALLATPTFAATIGQLQPGGGTVASRGTGLAPLTIISMARPSLENGSVNRATVMWTGAPATGCENAFKIKFFRPLPDTGGMQVFAERGPFNAVQGINNVTFSSVVVTIGDLIGITQLLPSSCGGVVNRRADRSEVWGSVPTDPAVSSTLDDIEYIHGVVPSLRASLDVAPIHGYLPVVGSTQGGFGSLFKTAVQLTNRGSSTITGRLVFHRAGESGSATDPSVAYSLAPNETQSIEDVVVATGVTGIGSMDVVTTSGYPPDITARIYNDQGVEGTAGFTEELVTPFQAMRRFDRGSLTIPADLTNFRMNIGVRTIEATRLNIIQYTAAGELTSVVFSRIYPADYFEQITASQFMGDAAVERGGYIVVQVESGSAFVYSAVTDNRTNDGAIRFPTKY